MLRLEFTYHDWTCGAIITITHEKVTHGKLLFLLFVFTVACSPNFPHFVVQASQLRLFSNDLKWQCVFFLWYPCVKTKVTSDLSFTTTLASVGYIRSQVGEFLQHDFARIKTLMHPKLEATQKWCVLKWVCNTSFLDVRLTSRRHCRRCLCLLSSRGGVLTSVTTLTRIAIADKRNLRICLIPGLNPPNEQNPHSITRKKNVCHPCITSSPQWKFLHTSWHPGRFVAKLWSKFPHYNCPEAQGKSTADVFIRPL